MADNASRLLTSMFLLAAIMPYFTPKRKDVISGLSLVMPVAMAFVALIEAIETAFDGVSKLISFSGSFTGIAVLVAVGNGCGFMSYVILSAPLEHANDKIVAKTKVALICC
jgi:hypothetical protein